MDDSLDAVKRKVLAIFQEMAGERAQRLDGSVLSSAAMDAITSSLAAQHGWEKAADIALHMACRNWDAAFIVALHLFPERFSPEEINDGLGLFRVHAPNHIREACRLTETYVWECFPGESEGQIP